MSASDNKQASHLRQSLCRLRDEINQVLKVFLSRDSLVRGSIYELRRKCGKPNCACASGQTLHSCTAITWSDGGHKRLRSLSPEEEARLAPQTENYRRFRRARAKLVELQAEVLVVIDKIEVVMRREP
jgi:hypothetical protein